MPIKTAMDKALSMLITKPVIPGPGDQTAPAGSFEGHTADGSTDEKKKGVWSNDMNSLNNLGN